LSVGQVYTYTYLFKHTTMKTTSKSIIIALLVIGLFFTTTSKAQTTSANTWQFSIGPDGGIPTGDARAGSNFAFAGTARIQYGLSNSFAITLTSGAYHFFPIDMPGTNIKYQSYGEVPIKAGAKVFYAPNLYLGAEAGAMLEFLDSGAGPTRFLLSPALGYASQHWDVAFHYESATSTVPHDHFGIVALRVAYGFGL
jgi:hypothetical protein